MNRRALRGGWVGGSVFNFLPFHVLGNLTSKTRQIIFFFFSVARHNIYLPCLMGLTLFWRISVQDFSKSRQPRTNLSFSRLKPNFADHLLVVTEVQDFSLKKKNKQTQKQKNLKPKTVFTCKKKTKTCHNIKLPLQTFLPCGPHRHSQTDRYIVCKCRISPTGFGCWHPVRGPFVLLRWSSQSGRLGGSGRR